MTPYILFIKEDFILRIQKGYPWIYQKHIIPPKSPIPDGALVKIVSKHKIPLGVGYYNSKVKLACRILTFNPDLEINQLFFHESFIKALTRREKFFHLPYYRLLHAEGDKLPGLIVDRYLDTLVCQCTTLGMEKLKSIWLSVLIELIKPKVVVFRNNLPSRKMEGLTLEDEIVFGDVNSPVMIKENDVSYFVDLLQGQKTGWFFDQRANRAFMANLAKQKTVLDLYAYFGGFGLCAIKEGANEVTFVDRSELAISMIQKSATHMGSLSLCQFIQKNVFSALKEEPLLSKTYDIVIADPPAFIKQFKDKQAGLRGYQKLAKLAAEKVAPKGFLFIASCSHHASPQEFQMHIERGINKTGRKPTLIKRLGADKDHPVNPVLPESHYLKGLVYEF